MVLGIEDVIQAIGLPNVVQARIYAAMICRFVAFMIQSRYKHLFWIPSCVHALNNALKGIG